MLANSSPHDDTVEKLEERRLDELRIFIAAAAEAVETLRARVVCKATFDQRRDKLLLPPVLLACPTSSVSQSVAAVEPALLANAPSTTSMASNTASRRGPAARRMMSKRSDTAVAGLGDRCSWWSNIACSTDGCMAKLSTCLSRWHQAAPSPSVPPARCMAFEEDASSTSNSAHCSTATVPASRECFSRLACKAKWCCSRPEATVGASWEAYRQSCDVSRWSLSRSGMLPATEASRSNNACSVTRSRIRWAARIFRFRSTSSAIAGLLALWNSGKNLRTGCTGRVSKDTMLQVDHSIAGSRWICSDRFCIHGVQTTEFQGQEGTVANRRKQRWARGSANFNRCNKVNRCTSIPASMRSGIRPSTSSRGPARMRRSAAELPKRSETHDSAFCIWTSKQPTKP
mmetsp:Transcript_49634/g.98534  ORF Transcript_49634/g.98534 Transcript_49634/m.98534 type:complete len:401 (+) Transcript_49634:853-2055(+)